MEYKTFMEALKGKQHKLDKNKNGKLDAHDFKLLRKEESDLEEETVEEAADRMARSDYKLSPSGRKTHKEITFPTSDKDDEKKEMKEEIELDEGMSNDDKSSIALKALVAKKNLKQAGNKVKSVDFLKKMKDRIKAGEDLKKEEKKDDLPFTPDPVKKNPIAKAGKFGIGPSTAKHLAKMGMQQAMKKTVKEETDDSEKIEMAQTQLHFMKYAAMEILEYIEMGGEVEEWYQNKLSKVQSDMESLHSYIEGEKRRTGMVKEEIEELDELSKGTLASYAKKSSNDARMSGQIAKDFENKSSSYRKPGMKSAAAKLAGEYKKRAWKREDGTMKAIDRLAKEEVEIEEQAPVAPVPDKKYIKGTPEHKAYMATKKTRVGHPTSVKEDLDEKIDLGKAKMGDVIKDFQASDAPQFAGKSKEKRREMAIAAKLEADRGTRKEETEMLSYKEFMMMLEYEAKGGVYRHSGTYGSEYAKKEREQDEKGFDSEKQSTEKRGRGRPAGAKSGARGPRIK